MKRLSSHERAALGLRQTISDLECASHHLDMVAFAVDGDGAEVDAAIDGIKKDIADLLVQIEHCQQKVYTDWHETQPPLEYP